MVEGTCANCIFSSGSTVTGMRICRRNAPQTVEMTPNYAIAVNYTQTSTKWPVVHNVDWCGEWRGASEYDALRSAGNALDEAIVALSCVGSTEDMQRLEAAHIAWKEVCGE